MTRRGAAQRTRPQAAVRVPTALGLGLTAGNVSWREVEGRRVDAIPHARRVRTVREKMPEVRAAVAALDLGAQHPEGAILLGRDVALLDDVVEARPAGPRLEFGPRIKKRIAAHDAAIRPLAVVIPVRAREWRLRSCLLGDRVLDRGQLRATGVLVCSAHFLPVSMSLRTANVVGAIWKAATAEDEAVRSRRRTSSARSGGVCERSSQFSVVSFVIAVSESTVVRSPARSTSPRHPATV